jgi:hypothetical protein
MSRASARRARASSKRSRSGHVPVGAPGEHQAVDPVEQQIGILDSRLVGRQDDAEAPCALDLRDVLARRQHHLVFLPDTPGDALDRGADPDRRRPHQSRSKPR